MFCNIRKCNFFFCYDRFCFEYYFENEPLGNAGALFKIKDKLRDDFLLLNADAMFDVDFNRFVEHHEQHGGLVIPTAIRMTAD